MFLLSWKVLQFCLKGLKNIWKVSRTSPARNSATCPVCHKRRQEVLCFGFSSNGETETLKAVNYPANYDGLQ